MQKFDAIRPFYDSEVNEALHLSEKEESVLNNLVNLIENEIE